MQEKKLLMTFKNTLGNTFTLTIDDPSDDLTEQNIIDAMNLIKEKNIFLPKGYEIAQCVSAKVVASDTTEYDLEVQLGSVFMENISAMIANLGFPIAVSIYLLIRIEGKMQALTDSINELSKNIHNIK